jgi:hypothetical protein
MKNDMLLTPVLQLLEVMKRNIQNKSYLRSIRAIVRKIKNLLHKEFLDKTIFDNLQKLKSKKLPNSYEKMIDNIILPILNIFKLMYPDYSRKVTLSKVYLTKPYHITNPISQAYV